MIDLTDQWVIPGLAVLADWSVRWGALLALLAVWWAVRPPRRAASRYQLGLALLGAGLLLPVGPRWGAAVLPWPSRAAVVVSSGPGPAPVPEWVRPSTPVASRPPDPDTRAATPPKRPDLVMRPTSPPLGWWRLIALGVAGVWVVVVGGLIVRFGCGALVMARLRREAVAVAVPGGEPDILTESCRALGLTRSVAVALHPRVGSPVVLGGWHPVVLVPPDWGDWPLAARRMCLGHELAHLRRFDDWIKLVQELVRIPFCWHPLVRWLLVRLDRERELLCDEAAVACGADPVAYAQLLLDLARRPGRLHAVFPGWFSPHGRLAFLDRRTVRVRIDHLLEPAMSSTMLPRADRRALGFGLLATTAALLLGGLRVHAGSAPAPQDPAPAVAPATAPVPRSAHQVRGQVLDNKLQPVAGATVVAGPDEPGKTGHDVLTTDGDGRFAWTLPAGVESFGIVATRADSGTAALKGYIKSGIDWQETKLLLFPRGTPFSATLVDPAGQPVVGAKVQIDMIAQGRADISPGGAGTIEIGFSYCCRAVIKGSPVESLFATTTDADGRFTFTSFPRGTGHKFTITSRDGQILQARPDQPGTTPLRRRMQEEGFITGDEHELARLVATPTARIVGQVTSPLPHLDLAGLTASYQASQPDRQSPPINGNFGQSVLVDAAGRFSFDGLGAGRVNVFIHGPGENRDWTYRAAPDVALVPGQTTDVSIDLIRGVDVVGTVQVQETGQPLPGVQIGVYGPFRPRSGAATTGARTDAQGHFQYRLPPGETDFYIMGGAGSFRPAAGTTQSKRTVLIPEGVETFAVPPIAVREPGLTVHARLLDSNGQPIAAAVVVPWPDGAADRPRGDSGATTDARGEFFLRSEMSQALAVGQPLRLSVRLPDGTEQTARIVPTTDGVVPVALPTPAAAPAR